MSLIFDALEPKESVFKAVEKFIEKKGLIISSMDKSRPWGGFFVIDENDSEKFIAEFFDHLSKEKLSISGKLSPKILVVAPDKRLSWQYHHRRAEIWKCIDGTVGVMTSNTDEEDIRHTLKVGDIIKLKQGERHRLIGLDGWGIVAEIWQHTDESNPSDEDDIVRLQDDYSRK